MNPVLRGALVAGGATLLLTSFFLRNSTQPLGEGILAVLTNPAVAGMAAGVAMLIYGALYGVSLSKRTNYILGGIFLVSGYALVYGGIDTISSGVELRDVVFSPGIALMGAGLYLIVKTKLGLREKGADQE